MIVLAIPALPPQPTPLFLNVLYNLNTTSCYFLLSQHRTLTLFSDNTSSQANRLLKPITQSNTLFQSVSSRVIFHFISLSPIFNHIFISSQILKLCTIILIDFDKG